jgi:VanZ family protein
VAVTAERWQGALRWGYWIFVLAVLAATLAPIPEPQGPSGADKYEHMAAFYALSLGAGLLYPRLPAWLTIVLVSAYGGAIELLQALPFIHRDCSLYDFIADAAGAAGAAAPLLLSGLRRRLGADKPVP